MTHSGSPGLTAAARARALALAMVLGLALGARVPPQKQAADALAREFQAGSGSGAFAPSAALSAPGPPGPVPKLNCTIPVAAECDACKCCQWCASVWNATAGWCMPVLDKPIAMVTCSKDGASCASRLTQTACNASDTCSWQPYGPVNSTTGTCVFDLLKCLTPPPPGPEPVNQAGTLVPAIP